MKSLHVIIGQTHIWTALSILSGSPSNGYYINLLHQNMKHLHYKSDLEKEYYVKGISAVIDEKDIKILTQDEANKLADVFKHLHQIESINLHKD